MYICIHVHIYIYICIYVYICFEFSTASLKIFYVNKIMFSASNKRINCIILNAGQLIQSDLHLEATRSLSFFPNNEIISILPTDCIL